MIKNIFFSLIFILTFILSIATFSKSQQPLVRSEVVKQTGLIREPKEVHSETVEEKASEVVDHSIEQDLDVRKSLRRVYIRGIGDVIEDNIKTDPEFMEYIKEYNLLKSQYLNDSINSDIKILFSIKPLRDNHPNPVLRANFEQMPFEGSAICFNLSEYKYKYIVIDRSFWQYHRNNPNLKKAILFHEIGHCDLDREHSLGEFSFMNLYVVYFLLPNYQFYINSIPHLGLSRVHVQRFNNEFNNDPELLLATLYEELFKSLILEKSVLADIDKVRALLRAGLDVNHQAHSGETALIWASMSNHIETVQILISAGANVNHKSNIGLTALKAAREQGHDQIVQILIEAGATESSHDLF